MQWLWLKPPSASVFFKSVRRCRGRGASAISALNFAESCSVAGPYMQRLPAGVQFVRFLWARPLSETESIRGLAMVGGLFIGVGVAQQ